MKLEKQFLPVHMSLFGLSLLLWSPQLAALEVQDASLFSNGGFTQPMQQQPFGGQVITEGQQMPFVALQQPPFRQEVPQASQASTQLYVATGAPAPAVAATPASASPVQQAVVPPKQCKCKDKSAGDGSCSVSKVSVHQDHAATAGMSLAGISAVWGSSVLTKEQREQVTLGKVSETSFHCMDDRVTQAGIFTPGGDFGEFVLALASYLQERDPTGQMLPSQEVVDTLLLKYLETIPASRPMIHCTDDRAIQHLEAEMPLENLDLTSPPDHAKASLLQKLTEVENHGDSHIRLLLKKPDWFQLNKYLVPMSVKAFYNLLWQQNSDAKSPLHKSPKLKLEVLVGQSDPQAFLEVSSGELCLNGGMAPMLTPRTPQRSVLISHLDTVSLRREELAAFFTRIANASPRKINKAQLHQRLDRHGWLSLETTGSRVASGLPFYTLTYS